MKQQRGSINKERHPGRVPPAGARVCAAAAVLLALLPAAAGAQPTLSFTDVTSGALAAYRAGTGDSHGPGGVFTDLDHDGFPELVLAGGPGETLSIFRNVAGTGGARTFQLMTLPASAAGSTGAIAGDYDGDGDLDLYVLRHPANSPGVVAANELWQNRLVETGELAFVEVAGATDPTTAADRQLGLTLGSWQGETLDLSLSAAWADVDRDGDLDLYVGNHDTAVLFDNPRLDPAGQRDVLYLNNGDGTFTDYSIEAGVTGFETPDGSECAGYDWRLQCYGASNAVIFADVDNDRWPDLVVTNKMNNPGIGADMLYRNLGADGAGRWLGFDNVAYALTAFGHSADPAGGTPNAMGIDAGDFDGDGDLDLYVTDADCARLGPGGELEIGCQPGPSNNFFENRLAQSGALDFFDRSNGFFGDLRADFSWGTLWLDADNDGDLDLHVATAGVGSVPGGDIADFFYRNDGGVFVERAAEVGLDQVANVRGDLGADYDRDGDVDLFVVNVTDLDQNPTASRLYQNQLAAGTGGANYLSLRLVSHPRLPPAPFKSTRDAVGARVTVTANGSSQIREVVAGNGNAASTSSYDLEFGLGSASQATVQIAWPSGRNATLTNVAANQHLTISEQGSTGGEVIGAVGQTTVNHVAKTVTFGRTFKNPVVFALPPSHHGGDVSVIRITDVQPDRFTLFVHEAPNHDGPHANVTVSWVAFETGSWLLADGTRLMVGSLTTQDTVTFGQWETVSLSPALGRGALVPVVLSQIQSRNDPAPDAWLKTRQRNAAAGSFQVGLEPAQGRPAPTVSEIIGWLAMEPARGLWNGRFYVAGNTPDAVRHPYYRIDFGQGLGAAPRFLASLASFDGSDGAGLRYRDLFAGSVSVKVEEDKYADAEVNHTTEVVSYLGFAGNGFLTADPFVADAPPSANFSFGCGTTLRCTFTSVSSDDQPLPGFGYAWVFGDGNAGNGRVATHTFDLPGTYTVRLTVTDSAGQTATRLRTITVGGPTVRLAASYVPSLGAPRTTSRAENDHPPFFDFYFDPNQGRFEERPGGRCNFGRPENGSYLKLWLETSQPITACTFQASWDPAPFTCDAGLIAALNAGTQIVIDTDDVKMSPTSCDEASPPVPHVGFNEVHWLRIVSTIGGVDHVRRVRFRQRAEVIHVEEDFTLPGDEVHDTYVSSSSPNSTFGTSSQVRVQRGSPGTKFGFLRAGVPALPMGAVLGSAQLQLKVISGPGTNLNLHRLCGAGGWTEHQLTWNNWGSLTGNSCGVFQTVGDMITNRRKRIDVTSEVTPGGVFQVGFEGQTANATDLVLGSSEAAASSRPKLVITLQR